MGGWDDNRGSGRNNRGSGRSSSSEAGSYLRLIESCITQLKAQGLSRTCNESTEEEEEEASERKMGVARKKGTERTHRFVRRLEGEQRRFCCVPRLHCP